VLCAAALAGLATVVALKTLKHCWVPDAKKNVLKTGSLDPTPVAGQRITVLLVLLILLGGSGVEFVCLLHVMRVRYRIFVVFALLMRQASNSSFVALLVRQAPHPSTSTTGTTNATITSSSTSTTSASTSTSTFRYSKCEFSNIYTINSSRMCPHVLRGRARACKPRRVPQLTQLSELKSFFRTKEGGTHGFHYE
jgi:hypothetical protein